MVSKKLYKVAPFYSWMIKWVGFERGVRAFVKDLQLPGSDSAKILDLACGTGVIGLELMQKFPKSTLLASDLEDSFLKEVRSNAERLGFPPSRVQLGLTDIAEPQRVVLMDCSQITLEPASFDIVSIGGALGHVRDKEKALLAILQLVKPGGFFVNLEMNRNLFGYLASLFYHCHPIPQKRMQLILEESGFECQTLPFQWRHFPANLTRVGFLAKKIK